MTSPTEPPIARPSSFDEWLQAFKEQATFFTGLKLDVGAPRWQLADVLPVLPFVGAGVGLAAGLVFAIMRGLGPGWLAAVVAVGAAILFTRALHEDGLADSADGLGPHGLDADRRLEIMRDSRNGTFGMLALALSVLVKVACLASFSSATGLVVLIAAHALSRATIAYPLLAYSPVHADGLGSQVGKPTDNDVWLAIGVEQDVGAAGDTVGVRESARPARERRYVLTAERERHWPVGDAEQGAPGSDGLVRIRGPDDVQARDGAQGSEVLDRLVGGSVLAQADRVVRPDVDDR